MEALSQHKLWARGATNSQELGASGNRDSEEWGEQQSRRRPGGAEPPGWWGPQILGAEPPGWWGRGWVWPRVAGAPADRKPPRPLGGAEAGWLQLGSFLSCNEA